MFGRLFDNCSAKHVLAFTVSFDILSNNPFWSSNLSFAKHVLYRQAEAEEASAGAHFTKPLTSIVSQPSTFFSQIIETNIVNV